MSHHILSQVTEGTTTYVCYARDDISICLNAYTPSHAHSHTHTHTLKHTLSHTHTHTHFIHAEVLFIDKLQTESVKIFYLSLYERTYCSFYLMKETTILSKEKQFKIDSKSTTLYRTP
jgi:hypothetical protein